MTEQLTGRVEITTTRDGINYESAIMSALIAQDMTGGPQPQPDPDLVAWKMSGGRQPGPLAEAGGLVALLLPGRESEAEAGS